MGLSVTPDLGATFRSYVPELVNLPPGGISALHATDSVIMAAGVRDTITQSGTEVIGAGLGDMMIVLAKRRAAGELPDRIVDLHFSELMADPVAAVEKLYGQMDRPFLGEHADAIRRYIAAKPKDKFGKHEYSPEEWGFDPAKLREKMLPYTDHYGVALEG